MIDVSCMLQNFYVLILKEQSARWDLLIILLFRDIRFNQGNAAGDLYQI